MMTTPRKALLVVDVQNDFVDGSLAVPGAREAVLEVQHLIDSGDYDLIVASRDWHPADHCSFSDEPTFTDGSWPAHCVRGTHGADARFSTSPFADVAVVSKGQDSDQDQYSAFAGEVASDEADTLAELLDRREVTDLDIVGLAFDVCVRATALDAKRLLPMVTVRVLTGATAAVTMVGANDTFDALREAGVETA